MGLEIKITDLLFQIVNFAILFIILKKFVFSLFTKSIEKEQTNIKEAKDKMDEIDKKLSQIEDEAKKSKEKAFEESKIFLAQAKQEAEKIEKELKNKAQEESKEILEEAKKDIENQKQKIKEEIKQDLSKVLEASLQKLNIALDIKEKEKTVKDAISKLSNDK